MTERTSGTSPREYWGEQPPKDRVFDVLGHATRRRIVTELVERGSGTTLDLTELVDADGRSTRSAIKLRHTHLPKLEGAGYVEWDREERTLRPGPRIDEVAPVVELLADHAERFPNGWP